MHEGMDGAMHEGMYTVVHVSMDSGQWLKHQVRC
jgi:hypothetical protein